MRKFVFTTVLVCCLGIGLGIFAVVNFLHDRAEARRAAEERARQQRFAETQVTIIEGLTNKAVYAALEKQKLGTAAGYAQTEKELKTQDYPFLKSKPKNQDLQGYLFPDTYRFSSAATESEVLATLLETFEKRFAKAAADTIVDVQGRYQLPHYTSLQLSEGTVAGLTLHQILTLASIIEKETGSGKGANSAALLEERRTVAGIFLNRLSIGMALQSDATVGYVTESGRASATAKDLETDSPYNTYKYRGLPPGPIANISYSSLYAALHPIETDYLYFLHSQSTGEVYYAKTFEEHTRNKARYLK